MKQKTMIAAMVFLVAIFAQTVSAGTYWYGGQAIYSDPVRSSSHGGYYDNGYYGDSYAGGSYYSSSYGADRYYYDGYPETPYQPTGFYYQPKDYLEGFPDYYYYDYPGTYNVGRGRTHKVYSAFENYKIDTRYYYYPQNGPYFDRYGRRY